MGSRKALNEISVVINNSNEQKSYNNRRQLHCDSRVQKELSVRLVPIDKGLRNETDTQRRSSRQKKTQTASSENGQKDVSLRTEFKEPSIPFSRSIRSKVQPKEAVTSTPISVSKGIARENARVPEFQLSPIADTNRILSPVRSSFDNVAKLKSCLFRDEIATEDERITSNVDQTDEESKKENRASFCSLLSKSYSSSPISCKQTLKAKWSDDDSDATTLEDDDNDGSEECGFLCVANSKPTLPYSLDTKEFDTTNSDLASSKQTKKLNDLNKEIKKKKKKLNDPDAYLYKQIMKEFEEVDKTKLCFV